MKVVLRSDITGVGRKGDILDVADGYARNYLLPKGKALVATPGVEAQAEAMRKARAQRNAAERAEAVFAGGCFWCVEAVFEQIDGVLDAVSGYAGGSAETANYKAVCGGDTGHAEAVKIVYDPRKVSYEQLLKVHFATHDPTTKDRQGNDEGPQYRSAIFYASEEEKEIAKAFIADLDDAKAFPRPIVTTLEPLVKFFPAEAYHQDYLRKNPGGYTCHWLRD